MTAPRPRADRSSPRRRLGKHERREAILTAAAIAFAREGFAATSMAQVSAAAGVSHLIVYRHFDSKEALYEAVLHRAIEHLDAALEAPGAVGRYGITPAALLASARTEPDSFTVLWRHATREPAFAELVESARRRLERATETIVNEYLEVAKKAYKAR
ncbi:MAG: TetR/AcrR family transcriptional regulator [Chloroflexi bacterium]|nr:TetR/AcrR family transcriptional regulator [Chloroflexota bacterium]